MSLLRYFLCLALVATLTTGCFTGTGPANRVEDFQDLATQAGSSPDRVRMAGKVQWHPGVENMTHAIGSMREKTKARMLAECAEREEEGWCFAVGTGRPDTGVFLLTDTELDFFRWDDDGAQYVVGQRVPYREIERARIESVMGAKYMVIYRDGQPLLLYVLINKVLSSNGGTKALYEALLETVKWE